MNELVQRLRVAGASQRDQDLVEALLRYYSVGGSPMGQAEAVHRIKTLSQESSGK